MNLLNLIMDYNNDKAMGEMYKTLMKYYSSLPDKFIIVDDPFIIDLNVIEVKNFINPMELNIGKFNSEILKQSLLEAMYKAFVEKREYEKAIDIQNIKKKLAPIGGD